jgi:DNA-binding MarR family transcriptional regulator
MSNNTNSTDVPEALAIRDALLALHKQMSLSQLVALLTIHSYPGLSVNDLADALDVPQQSASRHVAFLTGRYQLEPADQPPEAFVMQQINHNDPRSRALYLTDEGLSLVNKFLCAIKQK